jgi:hypothetical protein
MGVDYEKSYVNKCSESLKKTFNNVEKYKVICKSIYDEDLKEILLKSNNNELYDYLYFSGSFTLLPNPLEGLRIASTLIKDEGSIYITQTYQRNGNKFFEILKPLLKFITTIDFG